MADPTTSNILLAIPTRGSDSGVWDVPVNGDFTAIDGIFGGNTTISLSVATTILLSLPATGTVSASAGPNQSQNNVVKFTGTMTGLANIQLTLPRTYTFDTTGLTMGTSVLVIRPVTGTGNLVALPPGEVTQVLFDGASCSFLHLGRVGSLLDLCVATTPGWVSQCTVPPYLPCDGATYSTSIYPALGAMLGSTFGGNGINTFGVPDTISRLRLSLDIGGAKGRVTNATSGVDGATLAATGGSQSLQAHTHIDNGHTHTGTFTAGGSVIVVSNAQVPASGGTISVLNISSGATAVINTALGSAAIATTGAGASQNMPPAIVFGLTFIKT